MKLSYSLHSYGEQVLVLIQNVILCLLAYGFEKNGTRGVMSAALGAGAVALCAATPLAYAWVLSSVSLVANIGSLVPQILKNRRRQETGALSAATARICAESNFAARRLLDGVFAHRSRCASSGTLRACSRRR